MLEDGVSLTSSFKHFKVARLKKFSAVLDFMIKKHLFLCVFKKQFPNSPSCLPCRHSIDVRCSRTIIMEAMKLFQ